jgi:hypothetical protein
LISENLDGKLGGKHNGKLTGEDKPGAKNGIQPRSLGKFLTKPDGKQPLVESGPTGKGKKWVSGHWGGSSDDTGAHKNSHPKKGMNLNKANPMDKKTGKKKMKAEKKKTKEAKKEEKQVEKKA